MHTQEQNSNDSLHSGCSLQYGRKTMCGRIGVSFSRSKSDVHTVKAFRPRKKKKLGDENDGDARIRILLVVFSLLPNTTC